MRGIVVLIPIQKKMDAVHKEQYVSEKGAFDVQNLDAVALLVLENEDKRLH